LPSGDRKREIFYSIKRQTSEKLEGRGKALKSKKGETIHLGSLLGRVSETGKKKKLIMKGEEDPPLDLERRAVSVSYQGHLFLQEDRYKQPYWRNRDCFHRGLERARGATLESCLWGVSCQTEEGRKKRISGLESGGGKFLGNIRGMRSKGELWGGKESMEERCAAIKSRPGEREGVEKNMIN